MTAPVIAPLAVWDVHEDRWLDNLFHERSQWAQGHFPDRAQLVYRAEFYLMDTAFAVLYSYAEDSEGRLYRDPVTGAPARAEPRTLILSELPPRHLLERA